MIKNIIREILRVFGNIEILFFSRNPDKVMEKL